MPKGVYPGAVGRVGAWAAVLVALSVAWAPGGSPAHAATTPDPAVVLVQGAEMCSGFFVAANVLVTAAHCVAPGTRTTFGPRDAVATHVPACYPADRLRCDWAVVQFDGPPAPALKRLSGDPLNLGPVALTGYPWTGGGLVQERLDGYVWRSGGSWPGVAWYSQPGIQGFSGGPVERDGAVVAVHDGLVPPSTLPTPSGVGALVSAEMLATVASIPPPPPVVRRAVLVWVGR